MAFIEEVKQRCPCDIIVITDHMECDYAERLVQQAQKADDILVLPGMEVNFITNPSLGSVRLHILVVLPEECGNESFAQILPGIVPEKRSHTDAIRDTDLRQWVETIHEHNGLAIAAHVESTNGIRFAFRQSARSVMKLLPMPSEAKEEEAQQIDGALKDLIFSAHFDAIEIKQPEDIHYYRWDKPDGDSRRITTVLGLDAHCFEDYKDTDRLTLVKMTTPGTSGLRDALRFPETRIRFVGDRKQPPSPSLVGISISGNQESFFGNIQCAFSENLNCIIGPRGSGKSTLVEAIRYVFGYNRTLSELDYANRLSERIKDLQKHNLRNSLIRVYYRRRSGDVRVIEAAYDEKQAYTTRVFDEQGKGVPVDDIERCGDYPLRLYGWSEIETLGRDQSRQRALLDRMVPGLQPAKDQREGKHHELMENRRTIISKVGELRQLLETDGGEIHRFREYKRDFEELDQANVKECFETIDLLEAKLKVYALVRSNCDQLLHLFEEIDANDLTKGLDTLVKNSGEQIEEWWQNVELRSREVMRTEQFLAEQIGVIKERIRQLAKTIDRKISNLTGEIEAEYARLREALSGEPDKQRVADLRRNAKARLGRVSAIRDKYIEAWRALRELLNERRVVGERLMRAQNEVTTVRATAIEAVQRKLNQFMTEGLGVRIHIGAGGDRSEFDAALGSFLKHPGTRINKKLLRTVVEHFTPIDFANLLLERRCDDLKGDYQAGHEPVTVDDSDTQKLKEAKDWSERSDDADVEVLTADGKRLVDILELQEVPWDDAEAILLNDSPVDKLSPGQRSSAMLPLIALAENAPLVIDQPEDNLDNRLVGHVLVDILAALKEHRQIVVCTHNPNIVVSGDAEQVIVLQAESDRKGTLDVTGSIDNPDIVNTVIELMEGGREAFTMRRERYGI